MQTSRPTATAKRAAFHQLHRSGCFLIPNPWDLGSAHYLQQLGYRALATTSSGVAWSLGRPDNGLPRERVLEHLAELTAGTDIPLNADFENGFGADAATVAVSVRLAIETGIRVVVIGVGLFLTYYGYVNFLRGFSSFRMPSMTPIASLYAVIPISGALIALFAFEQLVNGWKNGFEKNADDRLEDDARNAP